MITLILILNISFQLHKFFYGFPLKLKTKFYIERCILLEHALLEIEFFSNVILGRNTRIYFCEDMHFYVSSVECVTSFLMWNFKSRYNNFL